MEIEQIKKIQGNPGEGKPREENRKIRCKQQQQNGGDARQFQD